ncbi:MAG TPA: carbonic anhydrase [Bryobacteraceae bacterium]|nr:carbonic anhydrase [Bryobacteraceae bacterium]
MKKVFHFDTPRANYESGAAVVWCFDRRFHLGFDKFLKRSGIVNPDVIKVAGGAKALASPERESEREFVLDQIAKSIRLHGTKLVILMVHSDCGGYGGLAAFNGDAAAEAGHHRQELEKAAECVRNAAPDVTVQGYFVDFEGVWSAD